MSMPVREALDEGADIAQISTVLQTRALKVVDSGKDSGKRVWPPPPLGTEDPVRGWSPNLAIGGMFTNQEGKFNEAAFESFFSRLIAIKGWDKEEDAYLISHWRNKLRTVEYPTRSKSVKLILKTTDESDSKRAKATRLRQFDSLPPIPEDHIRLSHQTSPGLAKNIQTNGLRYVRLSETTHSFTDPSQVRDTINIDATLGGSKGVTVFFDLPIDEHNRHLGRREFQGQTPPGVLLPKTIVGVIGSSSSQTVGADLMVDVEALAQERKDSPEWQDKVARIMENIDPSFDVGQIQTVASRYRAGARTEWEGFLKSAIAGYDAYLNRVEASVNSVLGEGMVTSKLPAIPDTVEEFVKLVASGEFAQDIKDLQGYVRSLENPAKVLEDIRKQSVSRAIDDLRKSEIAANFQIRAAVSGAVHKHLRREKKAINFGIL